MRQDDVVSCTCNLCGDELSGVALLANAPQRAVPLTDKTRKKHLVCDEVSNSPRSSDVVMPAATVVMIFSVVDQWNCAAITANVIWPCLSTFKRERKS